ncbi:hypothetical protein ACFPRL_28015 [Pseudoclavibacter helvolus]
MKHCTRRFQINGLWRCCSRHGVSCAGVSASVCSVVTSSGTTTEAPLACATSAQRQHRWLHRPEERGW